MTDTRPLAPLRVGVTLDGPTQPRWIARILESISAAPECELAFVSYASPPPSPSLASRVMRAPSRALFECFHALDDRVFARPDDALSPRDVRAIVGDAPRAPAPDAVIDVVLRLGRDAVGPSLASRARHGVWTLRFGARSLAAPHAIGLYEVLAGQGTTVSELCVESPEDKRGRVLSRAVTRADVRSVRRGRGVFFAKSAALVLRALRDLYDGRSGEADERSHFTHPAVDLPATPDNAEMLRLVAEHGFRYAQERLDRALYVSQWVLAWQRSERFPSEGPFHYALPPKDRFWADPFASVRDGRRRIFFEECLYSTGKGHISLVELDDRGGVSEVERVLEERHHLSYPFLLRHRGDDFMLPEGSERGGVGVYRARSFPRGWELVDVMLSDRFVSDVTLREIDGRWWLFADVAVDGTRTPSEEFHIFHGPSPFGPWTPHRRNPISSDAGRARPAGALFEHGGRLYRPAQDCATRYGYAVTFNEITRITPDEYEEVDRGRMIPSWDPRLLATHTINRDGDLTVIDAVMRRPR